MQSKLQAQKEATERCHDVVITTPAGVHRNTVVPASVARYGGTSAAYLQLTVPRHVPFVASRPSQRNLIREVATRPHLLPKEYANVGDRLEPAMEPASRRRPMETDSRRRVPAALGALLEHYFAATESGHRQQFLENLKKLSSQNSSEVLLPLIPVPEYTRDKTENPRGPLVLEKTVHYMMQNLVRCPRQPLDDTLSCRPLQTLFHLMDRFRQIAKEWGQASVTYKLPSERISNCESNDEPVSNQMRRYSMARGIRITESEVRLVITSAALCYRNHVDAIEFARSGKNKVAVNLDKCFETLVSHYRAEQRLRNAELISIIIFRHSLKVRENLESTSGFGRLLGNNEFFEDIASAVQLRKLDELAHWPTVAHSHAVRNMLTLADCIRNHQYFRFFELCRESNTLTHLQRCYLVQSFAFVRFRAVCELVARMHGFGRTSRLTGAVPLTVLSDQLMFDEIDHCVEFLRLMGLTNQIKADGGPTTRAMLGEKRVRNYSSREGEASSLWLDLTTSHDNQPFTTETNIHEAINQKDAKCKMSFPVHRSFVVWQTMSPADVVEWQLLRPLIGVSVASTNSMSAVLPPTVEAILKSSSACYGNDKSAKEVGADKSRPNPSELLAAACAAIAISPYGQQELLSCYEPTKKSLQALLAAPTSASGWDIAAPRVPIWIAPLIDITLPPYTGMMRHVHVDSASGRDLPTLFSAIPFSQRHSRKKEVARRCGKYRSKLAQEAWSPLDRKSRSRGSSGSAPLTTSTLPTIDDNSGIELGYDSDDSICTTLSGVEQESPPSEERVTTATGAATEVSKLAVYWGLESFSTPVSPILSQQDSKDGESNIDTTKVTEDTLQHLVNSTLPDTSHEAAASFNDSADLIRTVNNHMAQQNQLEEQLRTNFRAAEAKVASLMSTLAAHEREQDSAAVRIKAALDSVETLSKQAPAEDETSMHNLPGLPLSSASTSLRNLRFRSEKATGESPVPDKRSDDNDTAFAERSVSPRELKGPAASPVNLCNAPPRQTGSGGLLGDEEQTREPHQFFWGDKGRLRDGGNPTAINTNNFEDSRSFALHDNAASIAGTVPGPACQPVSATSQTDVKPVSIKSLFNLDSSSSAVPTGMSARGLPASHREQNTHFTSLRPMAPPSPLNLTASAQQVARHAKSSRNHDEQAEQQSLTVSPVPKILSPSSLAEGNTLPDDRGQGPDALLCLPASARSVPAVHITPVEECDDNQSQTMNTDTCLAPGIVETPPTPVRPNP